ncbi:hypothetical protein M3484_08765 [Pseudomonas sp. GX19020]|uniref:hypothetical protein n=1 Tax=Pseudomonas sp. GX19020 TaxID=2942277 RepID=UPI002018BEAA|nr:hypothetical protein [Pseudomonas sp. GX19020]MCL4066662.1 hypothetical protein [Pseudomonas sp. GX19020]
MTLTDPNYKTFSGRLRRIEKAHSKGYGFEAKGTMGRSSTWRRERSFGKTIRAILVLLMIGWIMKGAIYFYVGDEVYEQRVAGLATGSDFDPIAARIMSADPVTKLVASFLGEVFPEKRQ